MKNWLSSNGTVLTLSGVSMLTFLGRTLIDFRYVSLEFEALDAIMPFTMPYTIITLLLTAAWIWAFVAAAQRKRTGLIGLLSLNLVTTLPLDVSTVLFLCPTPCQTGWPLTDIFVWTGILFGSLAALSAALALWSKPIRTAPA